MAEQLNHAEQIRIDKDLCAGHGLCYAAAPLVFDCDDDGYSVLTASGELDETQIRRALIAVDACPERAISVDPATDTESASSAPSDTQAHAAP